MKNYLNLGCGNRYFPDWTNLDFIGNGKEVNSHNLLQGIPYPDDSFEVVYHSHVLEHFSKTDAERFVRECYRVLKPKGVLRMVVPDLEQIAKQYLNALEAVTEKPTEYNKANHEWSVIEMYDQTVRNSSGGEMGKYWQQSHIINEDTVAKRMGQEFIQFRESCIKPTVNKLNKLKINKYRYFSWQAIKEKLLLKLSGEPKLFEYIKLAKFRTGGEIHQWMYDQYSLSQLLKNTGFIEIESKTAYTSFIENWEKYSWLDIEHGKTRKPDSLFIESIK